MLKALKNFYSYWISDCEHDGEMTAGFCIAHTVALAVIGALVALTANGHVLSALYSALAVFGPIFLVIYLKFKNQKD